MNLLTMEHITKSYTDRILLDDVGFSINENEKIGVIGYQKSPFEENAAFVTENVIKEEYRGKGYGKSAFVKIQEDAREKGFSKMALNVFKHTPVSYAMYEKNGFKVVEDYGGSVIMEKVFDSVEEEQ